MPVLRSTELVERFRVRHADAPLLMITANIETALRHEA